MDINNLDREGILQKLHSLPFCMNLTALTSEGCFEVNVVSAKGTSYYWEGYNDFDSNIYCLKGISKNKIAIIKEHIAAKTFFLNDLNRTQLKKIIRKEDEGKELSEVFLNFLELPDERLESLYCYCENDTGVIYVCDTAEGLSKILNDRYPVNDPWESYSDEQLLDCLKEYEGLVCEIPFAYFD